MAARKPAEPEVEVQTVEVDGNEVPVATPEEQYAAEQAAREAYDGGTVEGETTKTGLSDLTDVDLVDQTTGAPKPLSATTPNLQGTVSSQNGRAILKIATRGYIGEEPVAVLAADAGEFLDLISALETAASEQKATSEKADTSE